MTTNKPIIDLTGYQPFEQPAVSNFQKLLMLVALLATATSGFALLSGFYVIGLGLLFAIVVAGIVLEQNEPSTLCSCCGEALEWRTADVELMSRSLAIVWMKKFCAYGRTYGQRDNEMEQLEWVRLMRIVAVCSNCQRFMEYTSGIMEDINEYDRWVIHEHTYGDPVPMELADGQSLTDFELQLAELSP